MTKFGIEKIREITAGAVRIEEKAGFVHLCRFTEEQEELYRERNEDFYMKSFSASGVKLSFRTNSENVLLKVRVSQGSSRKYFSFDVFKDGEYMESLDNFSGMELLGDYSKIDCPLGDFSKNFNLGCGEKTVCIHLPWSAKVMIEGIFTDDGSFVEGIKPQKKLLAFGDSITQGYDALRPHNRYISKLADFLGAQEFNKAIGGEVFFPELALTKESFIPDIITVAYGTNDWNSTDSETFVKNCRGFFDNLSKTYPDTKIFAITPIWRKEIGEERVFGEFEKVEKLIGEITKDYENVKVISGFDFVLHEEKYFGDLRLHPNDAGFGLYAKNLYGKIKEEI